MSDREFNGIWIPKEIWLNDKLSALDKVLLAEISSFCINGECFASNEYFAKFFQCSERTISRSIGKLTELGYIKSVCFDGRKRILTSNVNVCLGRVDKMSRQSSQNGEADKTNCPPINIDNNIGINKDDNNILVKPSLTEFDEEFDTLWEKYPRKLGRKDAKRHYITARKNGTAYADVSKGLDRYIGYINDNDIQEKYIKHGSAWFCQHSWEDDYPETFEEMLKRALGT